MPGFADMQKTRRSTGVRSVLWRTKKIADLEMATPLSPCHGESELDLWFALFRLSPNEQCVVWLDDVEDHILLLQYFRSVFTLHAAGDLPGSATAMGRSGI
jgi:hypothetical protein